MVFFLIFVRMDHWLKKGDQRTPVSQPKVYHLYEKMLRKMKLTYQEVLRLMEGRDVFQRSWANKRNYTEAIFPSVLQMSTICLIVSYGIKPLWMTFLCQLS